MSFIPVRSAMRSVTKSLMIVLTVGVGVMSVASLVACRGAAAQGGGSQASGDRARLVGT